MIMKIKNSVLNLFLISISALFLLSSCSLKYQKENSSEKNIPQLTFTNLHLTQYSDNKKTLELSGSTVEQYKDSSLAFIKDADFSMFDSDNKKTSSGKATLISADSGEEIFKFFDGIEFFDESQNIKISGDTLSWNGKTEQLVSAKNSKIEIQKDDFTVSGRNFSASAVSNSFLFSDSVTGTQLVSNKKDNTKEKITFSGDSMQGSISDSKSDKNSTVLSGNAKVKSSSMEINADTIELCGKDFNIIKASGDISGKSTESEIEFSASSLEYNQDTKIVILSGNVELKDLKNDVIAKAQNIEYDQNLDIAIMQIDVSLRQKKNICTGAYSIYRKKEQILELSGNAVVKQEEDTFRAQSIRFDMQTEEITMDGNIRGSVTTTKKEEKKAGTENE